MFLHMPTAAGREAEERRWRMTPEQCRAARALKSAITLFELGERLPYDRTLDDLHDAFEAAGVNVGTSAKNDFLRIWKEIRASRN